MLKRAGFEEIRQKGSHVILFNSETSKRVTIPMHKGKDIKKPLLRKIIELEAQMSVEQFLRLRWGFEGSYTKDMKDQDDALRNNPLWKETYALVEFMYGRIDEIVAKFPDERWATASKIRNAANDAMFYISQAVGSKLTYGTEWEWNNVRKNLFTLETEYIFADKLKFLEFDQNIIKRIDALLEKIDGEIEAAKKSSKEKDQEDLEPWLEKHRLWREINNK